MMKQMTSGRIQIIVGLILLTGLIIQCQRALSAKAGKAESHAATPRQPRPPSGTVFAAPASIKPHAGETLEALAARDALGFIQMALDRYDRGVRDYTCTFTKQELLDGVLTEEQVMEAWFREKPFSVRLEWKKNADKAAKVLYVANQWVEKDRQMAVVEPAGSIARLFVSYVMRPIDGEEARESSRRTIDQFGLRNSLALTLKYALLAKEKNVLDFTYKGIGKVGDRPTLIFERRLPYTGENGPWPDRVLVVHLDREMLLPLVCISYADNEKKVLLGRYTASNIKLNPNLPDSVFTKKGMGL